AELARQIVPWATAGGGKVNLIGHSQGSPTSRVAASLRPDLVASVTSINGVNKGSKVADVVRGVLPPGSGIEGGANAIANALGAVINLLS
ncbi:alpha/beta fold hydrolase, partial [Novosphingobium malaysiense]